MTRTKSKHICKIILKGKRCKKDVYDWIRRNKEKDINTKDRKIIKVDKEYIIIVRPRCKFRRVQKKKQRGYNIIEGFLR